MDGGCTLIDSDALPFGDWAISVHYEVLRFAVFLNEKLEFWLCFACYPLSTVLSQVFWQECLIETPESILVPFLLLGLLELAYGLFRAYRYHLELNRSQKGWVVFCFPSISRFSFLLCLDFIPGVSARALVDITDNVWNKPFVRNSSANIRKGTIW